MCTFHNHRKTKFQFWFKVSWLTISLIFVKNITFLILQVFSVHLLFLQWNLITCIPVCHQSEKKYFFYQFRCTLTSYTLLHEPHQFHRGVCFKPGGERSCMCVRGIDRACDISISSDGVVLFWFSFYFDVPPT